MLETQLASNLPECLNMLCFHPHLRGLRYFPYFLYCVHALAALGLVQLMNKRCVPKTTCQK